MLAANVKGGEEHFDFSAHFTQALQTRSNFAYTRPVLENLREAHGFGSAGTEALGAPAPGVLWGVSKGACLGGWRTRVWLLQLLGGNPNPCMRLALPNYEMG